MNIKEIKELREKTGAPIALCKEALQNTSSMDDAILWLRKAGVAQVSNRASKTAKEGLIGYYVHTGGKICAMVEVNCETDFVARTLDFQTFTHDLAMHIAAANPKWLDRSQVPQSEIDNETEVVMAKMDAKKPPAIQEKIVQGKLDKFFKETCLMEQTFVKDPDMTIQDLFNTLAVEVKEKMVVKRFSRFEVGQSV